MCGILLITSMVTSLLNFPGTPFLYIFYGAIIGWVYIRFFQNIEGRVGDRSEDLSFVRFFPEVAHPVLQPVIESRYNPLNSFFYQRSVPSEESHQQTQSQIGGLDYYATDEAERRRQLALQEVDEKLSHIKQVPQQQKANKHDITEEVVVLEDD